MEIEGLLFVSETTWNSVWQTWLESEGTQEDWQRVAKEKGWQTWEEWRSAWVMNFQAQTRQWLRYTILDPVKTVPNFRVGPSQSWQKNFSEAERNKHTFAALVERISYDKNRKVQGILESFPRLTEFVGIVMPNKNIIIIEGHHRATALAIAAKQNRNIFFEKLPTIALTTFHEGEETLLDTMLTRGSTKEHPK